MLKLGTNIPSLMAQRRLADASGSYSRVMERLSSGMRINRASDDAAGVAIAESLRADRRVFAQGVRNLNDGLSLLSVADSAIESLSGIVVRLKELAEQAANGSYGVNQRKALNEEAQTLADEYLRIAQSTKFNGRNLFSAGFGELSLQAGYGLSGSISDGLGGAIATGTFTARSTFQGVGGEDVSDVELADFNGDGILDLVALAGGGVGDVNIALGTGGGNFGSIFTFAIGSPLTDVATGDINGDGIADLAFVGSQGGNNRIYTRLGTGSGAFGATQSYLAQGGSPSGIELADLNLDGFLDVVAVGSGGGGFATVRLGSASGTLGTAITYAMESGGSAGVSLGDINGDGIVDMVTGGVDFANAVVTVRLGQGDGTFGGASSFTNGAGSIYGIELGDLNNDGKLDLITVGLGGAGTLTARLGNGNGTFGTAVTITSNAFAREIEVADTDGDGSSEIVLAGGIGSQQFRIFEYNPSGSLSLSQTYTTTSYSALTDVETGDVNGDGVLDLVTSGYNGDPALQIGIFTANTTDGVGPLLPFDLTTISGGRAALADFDRKIQQLAAQRGQIGAFQSRIGFALNTLHDTVTNYAAAESRIADADIAAEAAESVRLRILQQAAAAVLAQANQIPALALKLLGGGNA